MDAPLRTPGSAVWHWLDENFEKPVIIICLLTALILIPYQVFCRYILGSWLRFNVDTAPVEEVSIFCFIWAIYFAAALSIKRRESIRMTAFVDMLPARWTSCVLMFNNIVFLFLTGLIVFLSVRILRIQFNLPQVTAALRMPYIFPYSILFIGFTLMTLRLIQDTLRLIREAGKNGPAQFGLALLCSAVLASPVFCGMELETGTVLVVTMLICMVAGVPIAVALGLAGACAIYATGFMPMNVVAQSAFNSLDSFPMLAIFFFVAAGIFMGRGGLSTQLLNLADTLIGPRTGGLALTTVVACMFFGAISGSAVATVAAIGMIVVPSMVERGYSRPFAGALIACAGTIGAMIPPSNPFVLYGIITNVSIGKLFMGGIVPGVLTGLFLMAVAWWISRKNGWRGQGEHATARQKWTALWEAKWALMVPVIILGGIYGGIMTPTEAAAVAALYGLLVGIFVLKGIDRTNIIEVLVNCVVMCSTVILIVAMASIFGYVMAIEQIPDKFAAMMLSISSDKYTLLIIVNLFLLAVGALMEPISATIILAPILVPVMSKVGVSPLHFGIIMTCNLCIGFVTPPIGSNLFVASAIAKEKSEKIAWAAVPFLIAMLVMLALITFVPELSLYLTRFV